VPVSCLFIGLLFLVSFINLLVFVFVSCIHLHSLRTGTSVLFTKHPWGQKLKHI
jgi:hypothetical protein